MNKLNLDKIFKSKINQTGGLEDDEEIDINLDTISMCSVID